MKNCETLDYMFVFKHPGTHQLVGLWAHQDRLAYTGRLASLFRIPLPRDPNSGSGGRVYNVGAAQINGPATASCARVVRSIVTHCALLRYVYTNEVKLEVDLREFHITGGDDLQLLKQKMSSGLRKGTYLAGLLENPHRIVLKEDVVTMATLYEMWDLAQKCREGI
ncbi:hypothetical protein BG000_007023 [Podila horticola]|nr:hypothetical protein BG000_007023 [Podila horticola]